MWQNVKPECWQPYSERKIHDPHQQFVAQLYANEPHLRSNSPQVGIQLSWRARPSFLHCFALCIELCSELLGRFLHLLQGAMRLGVGWEGVGCLWVRFTVIWAWDRKFHYSSGETFCWGSKILFKGSAFFGEGTWKVALATLWWPGGSSRREKMAKIDGNNSATA